MVTTRRDESPEVTFSWAMSHPHRVGSSDDSRLLAFAVDERFVGDEVPSDLEWRHGRVAAAVVAASPRERMTWARSFLAKIRLRPESDLGWLHAHAEFVAYRIGERIGAAVPSDADWIDQAVATAWGSRDNHPEWELVRPLLSPAAAT